MRIPPPKKNPPTVRASVANHQDSATGGPQVNNFEQVSDFFATRCHYWGDPHKLTSLNRSPFLPTRCHCQGVFK